MHGCVPLHCWLSSAIPMQLQPASPTHCRLRLCTPTTHSWVDEHVLHSHLQITHIIHNILNRWKLMASLARVLNIFIFLTRKKLILIKNRLKNLYHCVQSHLGAHACALHCRSSLNHHDQNHFKFQALIYTQIINECIWMYCTYQIHRNGTLGQDCLCWCKLGCECSFRLRIRRRICSRSTTAPSCSTTCLHTADSPHSGPRNSTFWRE